MPMPKKKKHSSSSVLSTRGGTARLGFNTPRRWHPLCSGPISAWRQPFTSLFPVDLKSQLAEMTCARTTDPVTELKLVQTTAMLHSLLKCILFFLSDFSLCI